jgi:hypothetical protein
MAPQPVSGGILNPRNLKRVGIGAVIFFTTIIFITVLTRIFGERIPPNVVHFPQNFLASMSQHQSCASREGEENPLTALDAKYAHLSDEKFTIAMQTYKRPKELEATIKALTDRKERIPSLEELVVVWNNLEEQPPKDYVSRSGVPIRYRMSTRNSLNQKLIPDPAYKTKAILLTDDDVYYEPDDLEFVFQSWRKFGQYRLVGALPRCSEMHGGEWKYEFCTSKEVQRHYSMILTNLCFSHIAFLDYYSSDAPEAVKIRDYIDEHFNCEDIALNYLASSLTGWGPLEANGFNKYHNMNPSEGISRKPGHLEARSQCLNDFVDIFGCQPLVEETSHIVRGLTVL